MLKKISFWNKVRGILTALGVGSELTLWLAQSLPEWRWVTLFATLGLILITHLVEDKNNNGIVDALEKKDEPKP